MNVTFNTLLCSEMNKGVLETENHYQHMMFKEALRTGFYEFQVGLAKLQQTLMSFNVDISSYFEYFAI